MSVVATILWATLFASFYVYIGYPLCVWCLARLRPRPVRAAPLEPTVTIVIAAHNEAAVIGATLEQLLRVDYPPDKRELIVVSDGSNDGTDEIVQRFQARGVRLIRQEPRGGKTSALNSGVAAAGGEVIVFADANSLWHVDALRRVLAPLADPNVGYVTGRMVYTVTEGSAAATGSSAFMRYESFVRENESRIGSIVGVDGGLDAVRRELYRPMRPDQLPDFVLPLDVQRQGRRVVFAADALLAEPASSGRRDEYRMRVRVALRAFWALWESRDLLDPRREPLFAWQLLSHKWLRYLAFIFLIGSLVTSTWLAPFSSLYRAIALAHLLLLFGGLVGWWLEGRRTIGLLRLPLYLLLLNVACAHAFVRFLRGERLVLWTPRKG